MPKIRVFFDCFELVRGSGKSMGIYRYAMEVLTELATIQSSDISIVIAVNKSNASEIQSITQGLFEIEGSHRPAPGKIQRLLWLFWGAAQGVKRTDSTLYYSPKGFLPFLPNRLVSSATLHDLIPLYYREKFPGYFPWLEDQIVCRMLLRTARKTQRLLTISQFSAQQIVHFSGRTQNISVAPNGIRVCKSQASQENTPFLLAMTNPFPHKNTQGLLQAYEIYRQSNENPLPLHIIGLKDLSSWNAALTPESKALITLHHGLSETQLETMYAQCSGFLFLPLIEGFGFPPLEALAQGAPVLVSDIPVFRELFTDHVLYAPPQQLHQIADGITQLLNQPSKLPAQNEALFSKYTWQTHTQQLVSLWTNP